jgi:hypothetical protein
MIKRTESGGLSVSYLDIQIFFDDLFEICKNEDEIEWLYENLSSALEVSREERIDQYWKDVEGE